MERYNIYIVILCIFAVTSLAEVWIEILSPPNFAHTFSSLPLRKCGLKSLKYFPSPNGRGSLPLRKCGLKCWSSVGQSAGHLVTSLAEVWIEITISRLMFSAFSSLPLRKCGLKLELAMKYGRGETSLPLRKCGLKYYKLWPDTCL